MSKSLAAAFGNQRQFIIYRAADKVPVDPVTLQNSNAQDTATHMGLANAFGWVAALGEGYGMGVVITEGSQLFAIDLDGCLAGGVLTPTAHAIVQQYRKLDAYIEVSMSGRGVHIIGSYTGAAPPHDCKNVERHFEMYTQARYIALTGNPLGGDELGNVSADCTEALRLTVAEHFQPDPNKADAGNWTVEDDPACTIMGTDAERLALALKAKSIGAKFGTSTKATFRQLWEADADALSKAFPGNNGQPYDASSADQALCNHAAYWWANNCERILTVIQCSALKRDKWNREDYIRGTILKACALPKVWKARRDAPAAAPPPPPVPVVPGNPTLPAPAPPVIDSTGAHPRMPTLAARSSVRNRYHPQGIDQIYFLQSLFMVYKAGRYAELTKDGLRAQVYPFLELGAAGEAVKPDHVNAMIDALKALTYLPEDTPVPCWLDAPTVALPDMLVCKNGALDLVTHEVHQLTPRLFSTISLPVNFEPTAAPPLQWLAFLKSVWPNDQESIDTLQEVFGLLLTA